MIKLKKAKCRLHTIKGMLKAVDKRKDHDTMLMIMGMLDGVIEFVDTSLEQYSEIATAAEEL